MTFEVTIEPSGHRFSVPEDKTILEAALDAGFMLPYGCRNGACGSCKGRVASGAIDYGAYQESALSEQEKREGLALFCCARPLSDVTLESREVRAAGEIPLKLMPCRVQRIERLAPDVIALHLKLPANERMQFLAGQYLEFVLKDGRRRAFSIANAPHDDELLQLHVRRVPGGSFTEHVFERMKERDILRIEGPHGSFYLREDSAKPILLVAGGTGFAPIKAIVEHALHHELARPITLYWGARRRVDLYMPDLPASWAARPGFRYVPVLSEPAPEDAWTGRTGLVHQAVMQDHPDLSGFQVYACGAPAMIDAARRDFTTACRLPENEFFSDAFSYAVDAAPAT